MFDEAGDVAVLLSVDAHVGEDERFLAVLFSSNGGIRADVLAAVLSNELSFWD